MAVNEIRYKGVSYAVDDDINVPSGILYEAKALRSDSLEANSLTATVSSGDKSIMSFAKNDKVEYFRGGRRVGVYYLQTVERVGAEAYTLSALSAVGRLVTMRHAGGIYTGQTVAEVVSQICGPVPVIVESIFSGRKLYGYLPYSNPDAINGNGSSARDNLSQVLFAIGASLGTDEDGVLRVEKLWNGVSCAITADQINEEGCSTVYETPVSAVEITEHQWVPSQEEVLLFEGTAEDGTLVVFDDPAHDLTADGFSVTESGDNYAVLSAGSGTLTGKGYTHQTSVVRRTVTEGAEENVVAVSNATLVSLINSAAVANRLADYYTHRETIQVDVEPGSERAGSVVSIYHPWDKEMVSACVESRETAISGILLSKTGALVGFTPPQPEAAEELDTVEILTESGNWTVPEGVTKVHAVLIGGGAGGQAGYAGESSAQQVVQNYNDQTSYVKYSQKTVFWVQGGPGGAAGAPGAGGKILESEVSVTPGQSISFSIGTGGEGGAYSEGSSTQPAGSDGTDTTFGGLTTADGSRNEAGYMDPVSGNVYGSLGAAGIPGSQGHGRVKDDSGAYVDVDSPTITVDGVTYTQGASGGKNSVENGKNTTNPKGRCYAGYSFSGGGGPAYGANGSPGGEGSCATNYSSSVPNVFSQPGRGGDGATALPPPDETIYGKGGRGGNGGGGAGTPSYATVGQNIPVSGTTVTATLTINIGAYTLGSAGDGSNGGKGAPGVVLLYYRSPKVIKSGPVVTKAPSKWLNDRLGRRFVV